MISRHLKRAVPVLCGLLTLAGCLTANNRDTGETQTGTPVRFPLSDTPDALSSASILRLDNSSFAYVAKNGGTEFKINKVNVNDTATQTSSGAIGSNVALWTAANGKIALVAAEETGNEAFGPSRVVLYNAGDLSKVNEFTIGTPVAGHYATPLHHRDPCLAITDDYVIAGWLDNPGDGSSFSAHDTWLSIFSINGGKTGHIRIADQGLGKLVAFAARGNYLIVGGASAVAVFSIDASGAGITITPTNLTLDTGAHWMKDNGSYVLESEAGTGKVQVWKWGDGAPALAGAVDVNQTGTGQVQALSFGLNDDDAAKAYFFVRAAGDHQGEALSVDLANPAAFASPTVLFKATNNGAALSGIWNIERRYHDADTYYILSGSLGGEPAQNGVLVFKNPAGTVSTPDIADNDYPTAVRTVKTFLNAGHDILYVARNATSGGAAYAEGTLTLKVQEVNDD